MKLSGRPNYRGGPHTKANQLAPILSKGGEAYGSLLVLSAVRAPLVLLRVLRRMGVRILVNQNGVYYPAWAGSQFKEKNSYLKKLNQLSDHTFFQSEFARKSFLEWVGPLPDSHSVLYNPVECDRFHKFARPENSSLSLLFFFDFREEYRVYWDHLFTWIESQSFPSLPFGSQVIAVGNCGSGGKELLNQFRSKKSSLPWTFFADIPREQLPEVLVGADVMIHLIYNDVCPNKVLEAMASGVFVICSSAGGSKELVGSAGVILDVPESYDGPFFPSHENMSKALLQVLGNREPLRREARRRAEFFDIKKWHRAISEAVQASPK